MLEHDDDVCNFKNGEKRATSFLGSSPYLEIVDPGNEIKEIPKWLKKINNQGVLSRYSDKL